MTAAEKTTETAPPSSAIPFDSPHRKQIVIHSPTEIQAELDELAERRKHLVSLLKVSRRVYGEPDTDSGDDDGTK